MSVPPPAPGLLGPSDFCSHRRSPLDEACEELARQARAGPKEAVAATKQVQALAMAQLRAVKVGFASFFSLLFSSLFTRSQAAADSNAAERARVEPDVAAAASALKELVGAVRV